MERLKALRRAMRTIQTRGDLIAATGDGGDEQGALGGDYEQA